MCVCVYEKKTIIAKKPLNVCRHTFRLSQTVFVFISCYERDRFYFLFYIIYGSNFVQNRW